MLPSGMSILRQLIKEMLSAGGSHDERLVKALAVAWRCFFRGILPALDEIFYRVKVIIRIQLKQT